MYYGDCFMLNRDGRGLRLLMSENLNFFCCCEKTALLWPRLNQWHARKGVRIKSFYSVVSSGRWFLFKQSLEILSPFTAKSIVKDKYSHCYSFKLIYIYIYIILKSCIMKYIYCKYYNININTQYIYIYIHYISVFGLITP